MHQYVRKPVRLLGDSYTLTLSNMLMILGNKNKLLFGKQKLKDEMKWRSQINMHFLAVTLACQLMFTVDQSVTIAATTSFPSAVYGVERAYKP